MRPRRDRSILHSQDRESLRASYTQPSPESSLIVDEFRRGIKSLQEEGVSGAMKFAGGAGRGGENVTNSSCKDGDGKEISSNSISSKL
jgi:hypothetical protein